MMLPLVVGFLFLIFLGFRSQFKQIFKDYLKYKIAFAGSFLVAISWLALYYIHHPASFIGRAGQVSIFNPI